MNGKQILSLSCGLGIAALVAFGDGAAEGKATHRARNHARATAISFPKPLQDKISELKSKAGTNTESVEYKKYLLLNNALTNYTKLQASYNMTVAEVQNPSSYVLDAHTTPGYFKSAFKNLDVTSSHTKDYYSYVNESQPPVQAWVDFANANLGGGIFGNGLVQEEVMCAEMPELANAAAVFAKENIHIRAPGKGPMEGSPTPWVFKNVHRVMQLNAYGDKGAHSLAEKTAELDKDDVRLDKARATVVDILAMAAPHLASKNDQAKAETIKDLFNTFVAGFQVVKDNAGGKKVLIHTGAIGCGDFKNNKCVVYVLQRLAARQVGVDLRFWGYDDVSKFDPLYNNILSKCKKGIQSLNCWTSRPKNCRTPPARSTRTRPTISRTRRSTRPPTSSKKYSLILRPGTGFIPCQAFFAENGGNSS
jgi:hypothetical protein